MKTAIVRSIQLGAVLLVLSVAGLVTLVVLGVLSRAEGVRIGLDVGAVIGVCVVAGIALAAVLGAGGKDRT